jgi:CTP:molybdopterin cytidylyltransferase MocA
MTMRTITKAVFPVAGLGTRFLPATKASPKEMLPVVDKPLIQYAVEEAAAAGITDMIFITGRNKRSIEDHFDKAYELETELELRNKTELLNTVQSATPRGINCIYIRQTEALGLGHAVLCAAPVVGDEPFAVILADDLIDAQVPVMQQMAEVATAEDASTIGVMEVAADDIGSWGIVETRGRQRPDGADHPDRREAEAGHVAVDACRRRPLRADASDLPPSAQHARGRGRRDPADRRDRLPDGRGESRRVSLRRPALRLRAQARLSRGDRGLRAQASGSRGGIRELSSYAAPATLDEPA